MKQHNKPGSWHGADDNNTADRQHHCCRCSSGVDVT